MRRIHGVSRPLWPRSSEMLHKLLGRRGRKNKLPTLSSRSSALSSVLGNQSTIKVTLPPSSTSPAVTASFRMSTSFQHRMSTILLLLMSSECRMAPSISAGGRPHMPPRAAGPAPAPAPRHTDEKQCCQRERDSADSLSLRDGRSGLY